MQENLDQLHLGPFGSNLIGEPLYYFKEDDRTLSYETAILGITRYRDESYVFTGLDIEYSDEDNELGYRDIKFSVDFQKCMCGRVPESLYNIKPLGVTGKIW